MVVQHPVSLDRSQCFGRLTDRGSGQTNWLQPDVLRPDGDARRAGCDKQPSVGGLDVAELFAQRLDESVGGEVGGKLFQILAP
jgi:hypothetical protein